MWHEASVSKYVPALHKTSQESFKEIVTKNLADDNLLVVVFAEETLSPEDFVRDSNGRNAFNYLSNLRKDYAVTYRPYVQNPVKILKEVENSVEISLDKLRENDYEIPKAKVLIVDLNDAKENEQRFDMLHRHDSEISNIYKKLTEKHDKVLALYTSYHSSWVASDESVNRQRRSLLQEKAAPEPKIHNGTGVLIYFKSLYIDGKEQTNINFDDANDGKGVVAVTVNEIAFTFKKSDAGYWYLNTTYKGQSTPVVTSAPLTFSYHCTNQTFKVDKTRVDIVGLQMQPHFIPFASKSLRFGDAYDCVGFTSVPIWSGLFVTFILLFIMTFGLTFMMDIKTMDRFDDPKGKAITINAAE